VNERVAIVVVQVTTVFAQELREYGKAGFEVAGVVPGIAGVHPSYVLLQRKEGIPG
jgi:hypothetical protein